MGVVDQHRDGTAVTHCGSVEPSVAVEVAECNCRGRRSRSVVRAESKAAVSNAKEYAHRPCPSVRRNDVELAVPVEVGHDYGLNGVSQRSGRWS